MYFCQGAILFVASEKTRFPMALAVSCLGITRFHYATSPPLFFFLESVYTIWTPPPLFAVFGVIS